jgi:long-subunit acyl-CoA synthetase (AMP-forming)
MTTSDEIQAVVEGQTIPSEFVRTASEHPDLVALRWRDDDGSWGEWTFADYAERVARAAAGLAERGVGRGSRVVLMLRNIPEFHVLDMAVYFCGGTAVSIYNSSSPEQIEYLVGHCEACLGVVEDVGFLESFLKVRSELPALEHLGIFHDADGLAPGDVFSYESLLGADPVDLEAASTVAQPDDLATIIYTSGTTGPPKGVMITHNNVAWTVDSLRRCIDFETFAGKRLISYLPMAHIAERMTSHYQQAFLGYEVTCCPNPADIGPYAREVRPQLMFGVPRVWEKIHAGVVGALAADPEREAKFNGAVEAAKPLVDAMDRDEATDEQIAQWNAMDAAAFRNVRELVGLDQVEIAITGAAPIPADLLRWFRAIGIPLSEIYGMSESSGPMTWTARHIKPGTVGPAIPGCEVRLAEADDEIICRGGNVFQGYLNDPEKTAEALDEDGWLHSGDIGKLDEDGYFSIVDRKKELIITAGGKNISPANLEASLKMIPLVGQACVVGDNQPFPAALVVLDPEVATAWAKKQGIAFETLADLADAPEVRAEIEAGVAEVMAGFNNAERVKRVEILGEEWLPDSDELTPTSKLKRRGIHRKYAAEIEALYA